MSRSPDQPPLPGSSRLALEPVGAGLLAFQAAAQLAEVLRCLRPALR